MKVFITGATGFVGRALVLRLRRAGHQPVAWVRSLRRGATLLGHEAACIDGSGDLKTRQLAMDAALGDCDAVVNLAGENLFKGRWTAARKRALVDSRVGLTEELVASLGRLTKRPRVLLSASAVGYYGDCGDRPLDEQAPAGQDFLAQLCVRWEAAARGAEALGVRVVLPRIGLVLGHEGGVLAPLTPLFELGLGGPIGSGRQVMPWIHLHDLVESFLLALDDATLQGPYNAVGPAPIDNATFSTQLAATFGRRAPFAVPAGLLRLALGEAASAALASMRALPKRLGEHGFRFQYDSCEAALRGLFDPALLRIVPRAAATASPLAHPYVDRRRPTHLLQARTPLRQPLQEVFAFFCRAENLGLMTPLKMAMQIVGSPPQTMQAGVQIAYRLKVGPLPLRWRTDIAVWQAPQLFVDAQIKGPYRAWWHEHRFTARDGNTTDMEDRVFYAAPFGILGRLVNHLIIERQLRQIFWYRASAISLRFGGPPASPP